MTKEELIDKYLTQSAETVEQAIVIARRIASQHFGPCGNGEVVVHVAQLIMDNVPFVVSMDEPELLEADLLPSKLTPVSASPDAGAPAPVAEEGAPAPVSDSPEAEGPEAKESTEEAAPKAN